MPEQFKRQTAYKFRIGNLLRGKPILTNDKFKFLEIGNKNVVRINIVGNVIDKFEAEGEKRFSTLTLDDASGQIKIKAFGDDVSKISDINQGQTILVIGRLGFFNNEIYLNPEIIKQQDPSYLLVRKLEVEKQMNQNYKEKEVDKKQISAIKDEILEKIKAAEDQGGIDMDKLIMELPESSPEIINEEIRKLLEEGIIFEPRPGKVRWLG